MHRTDSTPFANAVWFLRDGELMTESGVCRGCPRSRGGALPRAPSWYNDCGDSYSLWGLLHIFDVAFQLSAGHERDMTSRSSCRLTLEENSTVAKRAFLFRELRMAAHTKRLLLYQYNETNVMLFLFNLLRIMGLYMFGALLAHPQEVLDKRHLVYCVRVVSVGCTRIGVLCTPILVQNTRTHYTKCRLCSASWGWASNARNM
jgi:hypothetical protein